MGNMNFKLIKRPGRGRDAPAGNVSILVFHLHQIRSILNIDLRECESLEKFYSVSARWTLEITCKFFKIKSNIAASEKRQQGREGMIMPV